MNDLSLNSVQACRFLPGHSSLGTVSQHFDPPSRQGGPDGLGYSIFIHDHLSKLIVSKGDRIGYRQRARIKPIHLRIGTPRRKHHTKGQNRKTSQRVDTL